MVRKQLWSEFCRYLWQFNAKVSMSCGLKLRVLKLEDTSHSLVGIAFRLLRQWWYLTQPFACQNDVALPLCSARSRSPLGSKDKGSIRECKCRREEWMVWSLSIVARSFRWLPSMRAALARSRRRYHERHYVSSGLDCGGFCRARCSVQDWFTCVQLM